MTVFTVNVAQEYTDTIAARGKAVASITKQAEQAGKTGTWQVQEIIEEEGQRKLIVTQTPVFRPNAVRLKFGPTFKASQMEALESHAASKGRTIVEVKEGYAVAAALTPAIKTLRRSLATALKVYPHEIDLNATWAAEGHLQQVSVRRFPQRADDIADKLLREWLALVLRSPRLAAGWQIELDPLEGFVSMTYGAPESLPKLVPLGDVLPTAVDPKRWKKVLLGLDPKGQPFYQSLTGTPHTLVQGPTGSGKTIALTALCTSHLTNGSSLVIGDAVKGGGDFMDLKPYCVGWADSLEAVADAVKQIYDEGQRRKAVLLKIGKVKVGDCSPTEIEKYKLSPLVLLLDEFGSLVIPLDIPKGADKEDPLVVEATAQNSAKSAIKMYCGKIARELRFVSVFLIIALQRADVSIMGAGEFRSNLGMKIQLVPPTGIISNTEIGFLFDPGMLESVRERVQTLGDGEPGLAIVASEGGMAQGVKVPYEEADLIGGLMHERGVPVVTKPMRLKQGAKTIEAATLPQWWTDAVEEEETANTPAAPVDSAPEPAWVSAEDPF